MRLLAAALRAFCAVLGRALAVVAGLLLSFYLQLGGDISAPVSVQFDTVVDRLREIARALNSFG